MKRYAEKRRRKNANKSVVSREYIADPPPLVKEAESVDVCGRCPQDEIPFLQPVQEHTTNEDEELYLLRVENLHDQCNEHIIVTFFASAPKPANIFLGVDGVILHKFEGNGCAYVLFQGFDNLNLGLLMNKKIMLGLEITVKPCTLHETMLSGCYLRRRSDFRECNNKVILLRNLPVNLSGLKTPDYRKRRSGDLTIEQMFRKRLMSHVKRILNPYHIWIDPNLTLFRASNTSEAFRISDWLLPLTSELAAFFIYMKKNWTPMQVESECFFIQICLSSWYSALEPDVDRISEKIIKFPITMQHVIRRPPADARDNSAVMFLKNLPRSLTLNDIASIFRGRVFIPTWNISTVPITATCMEATILFDSEDQASYAVNGIRQFTIRGQEVTVRLLCLSEGLSPGR